MENISSFDRHGAYSDTQSHLVAIKLENSQLKKKVNWLQQQLDKIRSHLNWQKTILATSPERLSDAQKLVALVVPAILKIAEARTTTDTQCDDGLLKVYRSEFVQRIGKSEQSISAVLKELGDNGIIRRDVQRNYDKETHEIKAELFIGATPELLSGDFSQLPLVERNHGGKRMKCPDCGGMAFEVRTIVTCMTCGVVHKDKRHRVESAEDLEEVHRSIHALQPEDEPDPEPSEVSEQVTECIFPYSETSKPVNPDFQTNIPLVKIPRCKLMQCIDTPESVQVKPGGKFYCSTHDGYVNEKGYPTYDRKG